MARTLADGAAPGAIAGLGGGLAFGAAMLKLGQLESIATLVRADSVVIGAIVHMTVAAVVGAAFGSMIVHQRATAADTLVWGIAFGAFFWFLGPLTLRPLILGHSVRWDIHTARDFFGSLIGHVVWGAVTGLSLAAVRAAVPRWRTRRAGHVRVGSRLSVRRLAITASSGAVAGVAAAAILTSLLPERQWLVASVDRRHAAHWLAALAVGAAAGALYAILIPYSVSPTSPRAGARLIQGLTLGFLAWIVVALTIVPLMEIDTLAWDVQRAQARFEVLPGYLLLGALTVVVYYVICASGRFLFSDELREYDRLAAGPQRVRAVLRGAFAGMVGGLIFTIVMVQVGALARVSRLVGARSPVVGFFVHMAVATFIGITYSLLFRRQSFDVRSAAGWGIAYGLLWWVLGALTLLPVLLGGDPRWTAADAADAFPSLIGHLAYGVGLGIVFYLLEASYSPWWITRSETETARTLSRRDQVLTSAPALWAFVVFIAVFVSILLARDG